MRSDMKRNVLKAVCGFVLAIICFVSFSVEASADIGAKPSIEITLKNAPDDYYIALLENYDLEVDDSATTIREFEPQNESIEEYLESFNYEGWHYFMIMGDHHNYKTANDKHIHEFTYSVPRHPRILVVSTDGSVTVSDEFDTREFNATITYDYKTKSITEHYVWKSTKRVLSIIILFILTLFFEWLALKAFKLPENKRNLLSILIVNALTNIPFNYFLVYVMGRAGWPGLFVEAFFEIIIMIVEAIIYCFALVTKNGKPGPICFLYGIVANIFSAFMGIVVLIIYSILTTLIQVGFG